MSGSPGTDAGPPPIDALDVGLVVALVALALALRLAWFGGFGLADDGIFWAGVRHILENGTVLPDNLGYRFTWWLPAVVAARLLGMTEVSAVLPYLVYSLLGVALVYAFAHLCFGRRAAVLAALLVTLHPLDWAWATLVTNDIALSFFAGLTMYCVVRATASPDPVARRRLWTVAGVALFCAYHSKVTGLLLAPAVAAVARGRRDRLDGVRWFVWTAAILFCAGAIVSYALTGTPLGPMHAELLSQGIFLGDPAQRQAGVADLLAFPAMLFAPNHLGTFVAAFYPHALVVLTLVAWRLGLRTEPALWWWLVCLFVGMELNFQRSQGYWITGFRNVRHSHVFVYPVVLLVAGYLTALGVRFPRASTVAALGLALTAAWQGVRAATVPHVAYADGRSACRFLEETPPGSIYLDDVLRWRCSATTQAATQRWRIRSLPSTPAERTAIMGTLEAGSFVISGGAREPMYGGTDVIPLATELPDGRRQLIAERVGPIDPRWRPEPLRIWLLVP